MCQIKNKHINSVKYTTEEFIEKAIIVHDNTYNYSLVNYTNTDTKIEIICNKCGNIFWIKPNKHLSRKQGCPVCKKIPTEEIILIKTKEFIKKVILIHGDKFDYSLARYINNRIKIKIICNKCGNIFEQNPDNHINKKSGCPKCSGNIKLTIEEFIRIAQSVHIDEFGLPIYNYSLVVYINNHTNIKIICPVHGIFEQTPLTHINQRSGCAKCNTWYKSNTLEFIEKAVKIHGENYDYSLVNYVNAITPIKLICNNCKNIIEITPHQHLHKENGCICNSNKFYTTEKFIKKSMLIYNDENNNPIFDYSLIKYKHYKSKLKFICFTHGTFEQTPATHLRGGGCPHCSNEKKNVSETKLFNVLKKEFVNYSIIQGHKNTWLGKQHLDIYFEDYNIAIEHHGQQHFKCIEMFGGEDKFKHMQKLDKEKNKKCINNNCKLLYFAYDKRDIPDTYFDKVYTNEEELIAEIQKIINLKSSTSHH